MDGALLDGGPGPDGPVVDGRVPDGALIDGAMPDATLPDAAMPDAAQPDAFVPPDLCAPDVDLVGCYKFELSAQAVQPYDDSGRGNHGQAANVSFPAGRTGQAMSVGGASSVRVPDSASLDGVSAAFTLEMWVRTRTMPGASARAGLADHDSQWGLFALPNGVVRCYLGIATLDSTPGALVADTWRHIACRYDGQTASIFVNGVSVASMAATGVLATAGTVGIAIGQNSPAGDPFDGLIDSLRIWKRARAPKEICQAAEAPGC